MKKKCTDCNKIKDITEFSPRKNPYSTRKVYRNSKCKKCMVERTRIWREANMKRYLAYQRAYWKKQTV